MFKDVEKARETRLWITQIVAPLTIGTAILWSNPDFRRWTHTKIDKLKTKIKSRKKKKFIVIEGGVE